MPHARALSPCVIGSLAAPLRRAAARHHHATTARFSPPPDLETVYQTSVAQVAQSRRLSTGLTLEYVAQGDASGAPVVLLHGLTDSWKSFAPVLPYLPSSLRVIVPSLRGHGGSDHPARNYTMRDMASDVIALLDALGLPTATVVGHSMGARVAMRMATGFPDRIQGMLLLAAFAPALPNRALDELESGVAMLDNPVPVAFARDFQEGTVAQTVPSEFITTMIGESLKVPAEVWKAALTGFLADDPTALLRSVTIPTHLIWGARDTFVPHRDQTAIRAAIRTATLETYECAGHAVPWEEPARVARAIAAIVDEAQAAVTTPY